MIYVMSGGGGGTSLNFEVVDGTTQPNSPKENTIWVNSDTTISKWDFSLDEPTSPAEGMVWFCVSPSSAAPMNALTKSDSLMVYPMGCKQYISGAWVEKVAKTYQNGAWVDWYRYLYNNGNTYEEITGGWTLDGKAWSSDGTNKVTPKATYYDSYMQITHSTSSNAGGGRAYLVNAFDLTNDSKLVLEGSFVTNRTTNKLFIWSSLSGSYISTNAAAELNLNGTFTTLEVDVTALIGNYYIGFGLYNTTSTSSNLQIHRMYLK